MFMFQNVTYKSDSPEFFFTVSTHAKLERVTIYFFRVCFFAFFTIPNFSNNCKLLQFPVDFVVMERFFCLFYQLIS